MTVKFQISNLINDFILEERIFLVPINVVKFSSVIAINEDIHT